MKYVLKDGPMYLTDPRCSGLSSEQQKDAKRIASKADAVLAQQLQEKMGYWARIVRLKPNYEARLKELLNQCDVADGDARYVNLNGCAYHTSILRNVLAAICPELNPRKR